MAAIELLPEVGDDFDRTLDHLVRHEVADAALHIESVVEAIAVLDHNPLIGRLALNDKRELIIGDRSRGYTALYRYVPIMDTVLVLAVRSQREAGYAQAG